MGLKGEIGDGFPQPKPAFIVHAEWDHALRLGPTTPKNQLTYLKVHGSIKTVQGSDLPPFEAEIVDGGGWTQEDHSPSGEPWARADLCALLRVTEPSGGSVDPEMETGLIRMNWTCLGVEPSVQDLMKKTREWEEAMTKEPQKLAQAALGSISFTTGDPRYKFLEHAVYVGKCKVVLVPPENVGERPHVYGEYKISYVAA